MKPILDFEVLEWFDALHVSKVRLFGTDHNGLAVDQLVEFPQPCAIDAAATIVAKMNNGNYRP